MKITTAFIFLLLSGAVAFSHALSGRFEYIFFMIPFIIACILPGIVSRTSEISGLFIIGLYGIMKDEYIGIVILYAASCWFFVYIARDIKAIIFIAFTSIVVLFLSFFQGATLIHREMHALLTACFYGFGSWALVFTINQLVKMIRAEKPDDRKYIELIERLQALAHEYVNTLKRGADNDRRGKD
jgi:hypothetical protein